MAEKSLEEVRAWKAEAAKVLEGLNPGEKLKKIKEDAEAYKKKHGLNLEEAGIASELPKKQVTMHVPEEIVPQVQKLIDDYYQENKAV